MSHNNTASVSQSHAKVPSRQRFLWGMGGFTDHMIIYGTVSLISVIYVNGLHYSAVMVSMAVAVALPRLIDAVSDPIIG
ncbi:hypothetical protein [Paraglaciecola psychrophila]|uniref:hypothetical protein n=1 Tax=Paraglaciecola psychrophila TaxID=326544 RepID=UPI00054CE88E|nr:hypothetical protein [Paraglaciecola psychrophila]